MFVTERPSNILVLRCVMCWTDKTSGLFHRPNALLFGDPTVNLQPFINYSRTARTRAMRRVKDVDIQHT